MYSNVKAVLPLSIKFFLWLCPRTTALSGIYMPMVLGGALPLGPNHISHIMLTPESFIVPDGEVFSKEQRIQKAVAEILDQEKVPQSERLSLRTICKKWNVTNRLDGRPPIARSNAEKAHFNEAESQILVQLIITMARQGFPLTQNRLEDLANTVLLAKHCGMTQLENILENDGLFAVDDAMAAGAPTVGKSWSARWLSKYVEQVKKYKARHMESIRANALNPESVEHWFDLVHQTFNEHQFKPENIWGMDETCGWNSTSQQETVIGPKGAKIQYMTLPVNRDSNTLIVSTSASGQVLHPYCIFSGKKEQSKWSAYNPLQAE